jgi:hypothetical protein
MLPPLLTERLVPVASGMLARTLCRGDRELQVSGAG